MGCTKQGGKYLFEGKKAMCIDFEYNKTQEQWTIIEGKFGVIRIKIFTYNISLLKSISGFIILIINPEREKNNKHSLIVVLSKRSKKYSS